MQGMRAQRLRLNPSRISGAAPRGLEGPRLDRLVGWQCRSGVSEGEVAGESEFAQMEGCVSDTLYKGVTARNLMRLARAPQLL